ncbi:MAG: hypothetical protein GXY83_20430 [Rhodopirellula sp.]|nr:hypothetical protein [Rhodopirellula sp.]
MLDWKSYSDPLTPEEERLGFRLREIVNPNTRFADHPKKVQAVVYDINTHDRIIKLKNRNTKTSTYHFQRFGVFDQSQSCEDAAWLPLSDVGYPTLAMAARVIESGIDALMARQAGIQRTVHPCEPGDRY